ncbi:alpha/beta fold hydrolase [Sphingomonas daechungensis]|uniref:alpha/beta fold hydrolase n=1 Tax=Sphingomonas daechungensis TaxID=1176646 RepID=UPI001CB8B29C|nr:alpha/beta hydrolase [Sphingomonas daechungensis]
MTLELRRRELLKATLAGAAAATTAAATTEQGVEGVSSAALPWKLRRIKTELLEITYAELGPPHGQTVILLHGWPYDIHSFSEVAPLLAAQGRKVIVPYLRGFGGTRFLVGSAMRNGQPAAVATDTIRMMDALGIKKALLAGFDWGARSADIIAALWPERCTGLVSVSGYLIGSQAAGRNPLPRRPSFNGGINSTSPRIEGARATTFTAANSRV